MLKRSTFKIGDLRYFIATNLPFLSKNIKNHVKKQINT